MEYLNNWKRNLTCTKCQSGLDPQLLSSIDQCVFQCERGTHSSDHWDFEAEKVLLSNFQPDAIFLCIEHCTVETKRHDAAIWRIIRKILSANTFSNTFWFMLKTRRGMELFNVWCRSLPSAGSRASSLLLFISSVTDPAALSPWIYIYCQSGIREEESGIRVSQLNKKILTLISSLIKGPMLRAELFSCRGVLLRTQGCPGFFLFREKLQLSQWC